MHLIIGPSNAGKTTFIECGGATNNKVFFASEFAHGGTPPTGSTLHYNLLFLAPSRKIKQQSLEHWDLLEDPLLSACVANGDIAHATVIVSSIEHLRFRLSRRDSIEQSTPAGFIYQTDLWAAIYDEVDLLQIYNNLFDILERDAISYRVLHNPQGSPDKMREIDRFAVPAVLQGLDHPSHLEA